MKVKVTNRKNKNKTRKRKVIKRDGMKFVLITFTVGCYFSLYLLPNNNTYYCCMPALWNIWRTSGEHQVSHTLQNLVIITFENIQRI